MKSILKFAARWVSAGFLFVLGAAFAILVLSFLPGAQPFENWFLPLSGTMPQQETDNQPPPDSGQMQPMVASPLPPGPTPGGELPVISLWMTYDTNPNGETVTRISRERIEELHVWARSDQDGAVTFTVWMAGPTGTNQWGPEFQTSVDGSPSSVGGFGDGTQMPLGTYHLEARMGETKVGDLEFEVTE